MISSDLRCGLRCGACSASDCRLPGVTALADVVLFSCVELRSWPVSWEFCEVACACKSHNSCFLCIKLGD